MKSLIILIPAFLLVVVSCSKSSSSSKPKITIKSITTVVPVGGSFDAKLNFSTSGGNLSGGQFIAIRNRLNQIPLPPNTGGPDTVSVTIPSFPDQNKGEFEYHLEFSALHQSDVENDTIVFKFAAISRDKVSSDTIVSPQIVILYQ